MLKVQKDFSGMQAYTRRILIFGNTSIPIVEAKTKIGTPISSRFSIHYHASSFSHLLSVVKYYIDNSFFCRDLRLTGSITESAGVPTTGLHANEFAYFCAKTFALG